MKLLHVDSSILGENSVSRRLSRAIVNQLRQQDPGLEVIYRDLATAPLAHTSPSMIAAAQGAEGEHAPELQKDLAAAEQAVDEFLAADLVVIGAPMYNFTIPSQLKAWIDKLVVAGKTFRYSATGPEGLAGGKRVFIASSRGGLYSPGAPFAAFDHQEPYLRAILGFIGVTDLQILRAEGVAMGAEQKDKALTAAEDQIAKIKVA
jgi:FMN-dependent NADH-azoreductase